MTETTYVHICVHMYICLCMQPTPVLLTGKFHGCRSLVDYSPWVAKSRTQLSNFTFFHVYCIYVHVCCVFICGMYMCVCMCIRMVCMCACVFVRYANMHEYVCTSVSIHVCSWVCLCICVCVCVCEGFEAGSLVTIILNSVRGVSAQIVGDL